MLTPDQLPRRVLLYARKRRIQIVDKLGSGQDGWVGKSDDRTAIKIFDRDKAFKNERRSYQRLAERGITSIDGFDIPTVFLYDEWEMAIEMEIVQPPFILDFGKAHVDFPPEYPEDIMLEHQANQQELWGDRWPQVLSIVGQLERVGIYYLDTKPGNIAFPGQRL